MADRSLEIETGIELEATMRDGTVLRADVYRPDGAGPWPVLLARTPYGKRDPGVLARLDPIGAARRGYLVVVQDCRGRFRSEGTWTPLAHERADGYDTVCWAARLSGADGRVAMYGPSYLGHVQWAAVAAQPPDLYVIAPEFTWSDPYDGLITRGGAYELGLMTHWTLTLGFDVLERRYADRPDDLRRHLGALNAAIDVLVARTYWELPAAELPTLRRLNLPAPAPSPAPANPTVPALVVAGWFDSFLQGSLDNYVKVRDTGTPAELIVGSWSHENQTAGIDGCPLLERELDWLDRFLQPEIAASPPDLPVLLFVMGVDEWRRFPVWPPESIDVPWYLHADGELSRQPPNAESQPDGFLHNPSDPVPTCGGALLMAPEFPAGPLDQQGVEQRHDVLIYTSEPLRAPLEVIGRIRVHLLTGSSASSADWIARLCDVDGDGVSRNVTDGILRAHHPDVREHVIDLWSTAHVFLPGHRIRVQIASSCFPRWDRNPGSGATSTALQSVYHDAARPSRIVLPVVHSDLD